LKIQRVRVINPVWDRCASKGIIQIGEKQVLKISFGPLVSTAAEMDMFVYHMDGESLPHSRVCVAKIFDADDVIWPILTRAKMGSLDSPQSYTVQNVYNNRFKARTAILIDPATDSMKYEAHMREFSKCTEVHAELKRFAGRMQGYRDKKKKNGSRDAEGESYEGRIKREYDEEWDMLMQGKNLALLSEIIHKTIDSQFEFNADIGLPPVPVIDSLKMLEYTITVNRLALAHWPVDERDTAATYLILAPEAFSDSNLMEKIIDYIRKAETKFIVIKFKNLELDHRNKVDERLRMKDLLMAISEVKHEHGDDRVFVALEAGIQSYLLAVGGFDIVSTSMTGYDGDYPFRRTNKTAINGYFDISTLLLRDDKYVRRMLEKGGFPHEGCVCSTVRDYTSASLDWYRIRREHYVKRMNELYAEIWEHIDSKTIEECKARISRSSLSNLKHALPYLEYV
jgi:hypothetical protein